MSLDAQHDDALKGADAQAAEGSAESAADDRRHPHGGSNRSRVAVPLIAAAAVLVVAVGTPMLLRGDAATSGSARPPALRLSSLGSADGAAEAPVRAGAPGAVARLGTYRLTGTLPAGPSSATVHRPEPMAGNAVVSRLARALRLRGAVATGGGDWVVREGEAVLRVARATGYWTYVRDRSSGCVPEPADPARAAGSAVGCVVNSLPTRPSGIVDDPTAMTAAQPVLAAAGASPAAARVTPGRQARVSVDPVVGGLPVSGLRTEVTVDDRGVLTAYGSLAKMRPGTPYPLVSAKQAYDQLTAGPAQVPAIGCPEGAARTAGAGASPETPEAPRGECGGVLTVTGARLGLLAATDDAGPLLVPAWLFTVQGWDDPLAQVAVTPELVDRRPPADPAPGGSGGSGGSGSSGGSSPGSPGVRATDPEPVQIAAVAASGDGRVLTLTSSTTLRACGTRFAATAKETGDVVAVSMAMVDPGEGDSTCVNGPRPQARVTLASPLGARTVVDATTGQPVNVGRTP